MAAPADVAAATMIAAEMQIAAKAAVMRCNTRTSLIASVVANGR